MRIRARLWVLAVACGLTLCACPGMGDLLGIGDAAPALSILQWIQGDPVDVTETSGEHVYVVEFFSTGCSYCVDSTEHLTELQQEREDEGLIVVAISTQDASEVTAFLQQTDVTMGYRVAVDNHGATWDAYMEASGWVGVPTVFVIDQNGLIAWIGRPSDSALDDVLDSLVPNTAR